MGWSAVSLFVQEVCWAILPVDFKLCLGGKISIYVELCEKTREEAFQQMMEHAAERGANAILSVRYDANEVISGVNEVLAYGTAVYVERA